MSTASKRYGYEDNAWSRLRPTLGKNADMNNMIADFEIMYQKYSMRCLLPPQNTNTAHGLILQQFSSLNHSLTDCRCGRACARTRIHLPVARSF
jgi:hypothetical protein